MNIKLKSFQGIGRCVMKLVLAGCLATAAQGANVFTSTDSLGTAREYHTATLLPNGKVLVAGGASQFAGFAAYGSASAELYDPATGTWSPTGSMGTARQRHTATQLPNGKVLVAGGAVSGSSVGSAELYDPATGAWSPTGRLGTNRQGHTATLLASGKVLVAGGLNYNLVTLASAELFDPATDTWSPTGSLGSARYFHTATLLPNGQVLIAAGHFFGDDTSNYGSISSAELYGPGMSFLNPIFNPIKLGDGSFRFGFSNPSGPSYSVLASPDFAAPLTTWSNLGPAAETPPGSGQFQFTDHQAPNYPQRFYCVTTP